MATLLLEPEVETKSKVSAKRVARPKSGRNRSLVVLNLSSLEEELKTPAPHPVRTQRDRQAAQNETQPPPFGTYGCGFDGSILGALFGLVFFIVAVTNGSVLFSIIAGAFGIACIGQALTIPYEVRNEGDWVEFISFTGTKRVKPADIRGFVRHEYKESRGLHHMDVSFGGSSVTLYTDSENLFRALTRISPKAWVRTEEYVPPDSD